MMHFRNHADGDFLIAHFQGGVADQLWPAVKTFQDAKVSVPDDVTVVTFASQFARDSLFVQQLEERGIPYLNPARDRTQWRNPLKIQLTIDALAEVATPYVLICDGNDVMLTGPLTDVVARFREYAAGLLFGATKTNHPPIYIDKVRDRDWRGEFRYLNAGTAFGFSDAARAFYRRAEELRGELDNPWDSEQFVIRHAFAEHVDSVDFDWRCRIFQTFAKANIEQVDDIVRVS